VCKLKKDTALHIWSNAENPIKSKQIKNNKMKHFFLSIATLLLAATAFGQTDSKAMNDLFANYQKIEKQYREFYNNKEYKQTEKLLLEMLNLSRNLKLDSAETKKYQQNIEMINANTYYNLACSYSLLNKKKEAVLAYDKSIQYGYNNYRHVLSDSDLDNIRKDKKFVVLTESIKQFDKLIILQSANGYQKENNDTLPKFVYQSADNENLKQVRKFFNLDSIAGNGDEISKILNILKWTHDNISHDGNNWALAEFDAIDLYNYHKATGKGVNCRQLAQTLNEMYLSMGIPSRFVTCMPKNPQDPDCHVINSVWSSQLQKWIWIDPTFNAYIKDENGNLLSITEVRDRLISNKPLVLNEDANWNNQNKQTKENYLESYMAKNLYWIQCVDNSRFNAESRYRQNENNYIALMPLGFEVDLPQGIINPKYVTHNPDYFWQKPENIKQ
jgi:hypothetical protein